MGAPNIYNLEKARIDILYSNPNGWERPESGEKVVLPIPRGTVLSDYDCIQITAINNNDEVTTCFLDVIDKAKQMWNCVRLDPVVGSFWLKGVRFRINLDTNQIEFESDCMEVSSNGVGSVDNSLLRFTKVAGIAYYKEVSQDDVEFESM